MKNTIKVKDMSINNEKETIDIYGLRATGKEMIDKILKLISPDVEESTCIDDVCMHVHNGSLTLVSNDDDTLTCTKCNTTFRDVAGSKDEIIDACKLILDALNMHKGLAVILGTSDEDKETIIQAAKVLDRLPNVIDKVNHKFESFEKIHAYDPPQNPLSVQGIVGGSSYLYPPMQQYQSPQCNPNMSFSGLGCYPRDMFGPILPPKL